MLPDCIVLFSRSDPVIVPGLAYRPEADFCIAAIGIGIEQIGVQASRLLAGRENEFRQGRRHRSGITARLELWRCVTFGSDDR